MVVRKFNWFKFIAFILVVLGIILGIIKYISVQNYKKTYDYKLTQVGYSVDEINRIKEKLNNEQIDIILKKEYNSELNHFLNEKYFKFDKLDDYYNYKKTHKKEDDYSKIVTIINCHLDVDWLDQTFETDTSKGDLMLVNRLYGLGKDYEPSDIVNIPVRYAYNGKKISERILGDIISLADEARANGYTFVVSEGYRSYEEQEKLYNGLLNSIGRNETDAVAAAPGHSEYQTGLAFELVPYNKVFEDPKSSEEYIWLKQNAHKYGFIFRLESEKESITQFKASTWKLRYVGVDAATIMHNNNLCLEEYYAYYVER